MKNCGFKLLSIVLSLIIILSSTVVCMPSFAKDYSFFTDIPLIYVYGQGVSLFRKDENLPIDADEGRIYPVTIPDGFIEKAVKENIGIFAKAVFTQKWKPFGDALSEILTELYGPLALDENGNTTDESYHYHPNQIQNIDAQKTNGKYAYDQFEFFYDFRLDPYKVAEELHDYIKAVVDATGNDHVALLGRCLGGCIISAYMEKYDGEYISDLIYYCGAQNGATVVSTLFSGDLYLDADAAERFVYDMEITGEEITDELINAFITLFNDTYGLDLTFWAVNNVFPDIYLDILPQVFINTFGTWPGYWSMVDDNYYERAKDNVFHNADMDKWSGFVKIIDSYHYNVQCKLPKILKNFEERGVNVFNICKYGYQAIPISTPSDIISDNTCQLDQASMGATVTSMLTTFDDEYMLSAEKNGTLKYISPDKQVDASTCLFPDTTWFIKNIEHRNFPDSISILIAEIINNRDYNVNSDSNYPQYMMYENEQVVPMTQSNCNTNEKYDVTLFDAIKTICKNLCSLLKGFIQSKINII